MRSIFIILAAALALGPAARAAAPEYDVVIYGGTAGGIAAAVQVARMGKRAIVIEPTRRIGGLTTGGLGATDIGNKGAIGGIAREFYRAVRVHYADPAAWRWQAPGEYVTGGKGRNAAAEDAMWTFEPSVALAILEGWVRENRIEVARCERLDRVSGVTLSGEAPSRIASIRMESGRAYRARMYIDATYEGDLMAAAGVEYAVGRESNALYGETLNGVQTAQARFHQLAPGIDPHVRAGDPASGLLPFIDPRGPGEEGAGDRRVQAYCFRMCLTDHPDNRIPFEKPAGYDERWYELLLRNYEAGESGFPWINTRMPNRKTDTNNRLGVSTDFIGQNYDYPEATAAERERIAARHRLYQQGLMWTLANHPRVPSKIREEVARWGMCRDEFVEGRGWQEQLYVREARRMIGDLVMTQHHCQGRSEAEQSVGLGAYGMDSHHVQRYVDRDGHVRNEGDVEVGGFSPYPIGYRAIVPKAGRCGNLLVPICVSASHIAYGSIRMEPVFMVLGQSAATAAVRAIEEGVPVQRVDYGRLCDRLLADRQILAWTGPKTSGGIAGRDPSEMGGVVIDDVAATASGFDGAGAVTAPFVGRGYRHDGNVGKGEQTIRFPFRVPAAGGYDVRIAHCAHPNRATNVPVVIRHAGGETTARVNQRRAAAIDGLWETLGRFEFRAGEEYSVEITNRDTDGYVIADAVQIVRPE